jgi:D-aspartate ligase
VTIIGAKVKMEANAKWEPSLKGILNGGPIAVVLDLGLTGLGIARSLGREGIPVIGVDYPRVYTPGRQSRYCTSFQASDPTREPRLLLNFLIELAEQLPEKAILFPAAEPYVLFMSKFRNELRSYFQFSIPSQDIIDAIIDKRKQYSLARNLGIPCPTTYSLDNLRQLQHVQQQMEYPALIKPCYSKGTWSHRYPGIKGFQANTPTQLVEVWKQLSHENLHVFAQSVVRGPDSNVFEALVYITKNGTPIASLVTRKLRQYPLMFGNGTVMETVHNEDIMGLALRFFRGIGYTGLGFIELKLDERDWKYRLIELNPRLNMQNILATHAGLNFPLIQCMDLIGSPIRNLRDYEDGVKWLDTTFDTLAAIALFRSGRLSIGNWFRSMNGVNCHAVFARDDLKPCIDHYSTRLLRLSKYLTRRLSKDRRPT